MGFMHGMSSKYSRKCTEHIFRIILTWALVRYECPHHLNTTPQPPQPNMGRGAAHRVGRVGVRYWGGPVEYR